MCCVFDLRLIKTPHTISKISLTISLSSFKHCNSEKLVSVAEYRGPGNDTQRGK